MTSEAARPGTPSAVDVTVGNRRWRGRAVDFAVESVDIPPGVLVRAVQGDGATGGDDGSGSGTGTPVPADAGSDRVPVRVDCPAPGPVHRHVGHIGPETGAGTRPGAGFDGRGALAAAARSRGLVAPREAELDEARERLAALDVPGVDAAAARRRVAEAGAEVDRLRERVATIRGRVEALRSTDGASASEVESELATAMARLSEVETERIAAEQRLDRLEAAAREARDRREERLRLQDRAANLERRVRAWLADAVRAEFAAAVRALPGADGAASTEVDGAASTGEATTDRIEVDPVDAVTAALAVVRVAEVSAPVVLSIRRFGSAAEAATRLDAPVVRV